MENAFHVYSHRVSSLLPSLGAPLGAEIERLRLHNQSASLRRLHAATEKCFTSKNIHNSRHTCKAIPLLTLLAPILRSFMLRCQGFPPFWPPLSPMSLLAIVRLSRSMLSLSGALLFQRIFVAVVANIYRARRKLWYIPMRFNR